MAGAAAGCHNEYTMSNFSWVVRTQSEGVKVPRPGHEAHSREFLKNCRLGLNVYLAFRFLTFLVQKG